MEDIKIIDLYWQRSESAIAETAAKYGNYCHNISYNILHDREDAEECVNDTWLKAWNTMPPGKPNSLPAFLGKITRNLSFNKYKSRTAKKRIPDNFAAALSELENCISTPDSTQQLIEERILTDCLNHFLYNLPEQKRTIFIRRYWYLCPISDIAMQFHISENKVRLILFRTRKKLKLYLEKEGISL